MLAAPVAALRLVGNRNTEKHLSDEEIQSLVALAHAKQVCAKYSKNPLFLQCRRK